MFEKLFCRNLQENSTNLTVMFFRFNFAHIWVCPPEKDDDDYMFNCHPSDQKILPQNILIKWYIRMLKIGIVSCFSLNAFILILKLKTNISVYV